MAIVHYFYPINFKLMKKLYTIATFLFLYFNATCQESTVMMPMLNIRSGHTLTKFNRTTDENKVIAIGGYDQTKNLKTAEIFDINANSWTLVDSMQNVRYTHTANTINNDDELIVIGGWDGGSNNYSSTEIYNINTNTWRMGPNMSVGRSGHTATNFGNNKILIVGGFTGTENTNVIEVYDGNLDSIFVVGYLEKGRSYHTATLFGNNKILVCGGYNPAFNFQMNSVEIINLNDYSVTAGPNMSYARDYHSAIELNAGNDVFVSGGREFVGNGFIGINKVEIYNSQTNTWESKNDMPVGQSYHEIFPYYTFSGIRSLFLIGGVKTSGGLGLDSANSCIYNLDGDYWDLYYTTKTSSFEMRSIFIDNLEQGENGILITGGVDNSVELIHWFAVEGISKQKNKNRLTIYPNPSSEYIEISNAPKNVTISFYATDGRMVKQVNTSEKIAVTDLPKGIYTLKIVSEKELYTHKLVIE
jgi:hypothetical protein